jgi:hypothetical protein
MWVRSSMCRCLTVRYTSVRISVYAFPTIGNGWSARGVRTTPPGAHPVRCRARYREHRLGCAGQQLAAHDPVKASISRSFPEARTSASGPAGGRARAVGADPSRGSTHARGGPEVLRSTALDAELDRTADRIDRYRLVRAYFSEGFRLVHVTAAGVPDPAFRTHAVRELRRGRFGAPWTGSRPGSTIILGHRHRSAVARQ